MRKKVLSLLLVVAIVGCKNGKKNGQFKEEPIIESKKEEVINNIVLPNYPLWTLNRLSLEEIKNDSYNNKKAFMLSRTDTAKTAYALVNHIAVSYGSNYRASVIVKKATVGNLFGLRIIGEYPNRVDAIFDLKNGRLKGVADVGDFVNGKGSVIDLGNGWFKCNLNGEVNADKIKIILGPTFGLGKTITWEAPTKEKCNIYILPSSLTLEELSN